MIKIDNNFIESKRLYPHQILIEYPTVGTATDHFVETDEERIRYWKVESSVTGQTVIVTPVFQHGGGIRFLAESELTNGRWWVR